VTLDSHVHHHHVFVFAVIRASVNIAYSWILYLVPAAGSAHYHGELDRLTAEVVDVATQPIHVHHRVVVVFVAAAGIVVVVVVVAKAVRSALQT